MRYEALQLGQVNNPKCPDKYTDASTRLTPDARRLIMQISLKAVYVQLGIMPQGRGSNVGSVVWQEEEPWLPITASLGRRFDSIRVRNYTPGEEAQILVVFE